MNARTLKVYAIKDELTARFYQPLYMTSDEEAIRYFKFILNDNKLWKSNPSMYSIYYLADFNEETGFIGTIPTMIQGGLSIVEKE